MACARHTHTHARARELAPSALPCGAGCWLSAMMDVPPCAAQLCLPPILSKWLHPAAWHWWWMEGPGEGERSGAICLGLREGSWPLTAVMDGDSALPSVGAGRLLSTALHTWPERPCGPGPAFAGARGPGSQHTRRAGGWRAGASLHLGPSEGRTAIYSEKRAWWASPVFHLFSFPSARSLCEEKRGRAWAFLGPSELNCPPPLTRDTCKALGTVSSTRVLSSGKAVGPCFAPALGSVRA